MTREQAAKLIKKMRDRDREMVTGIFKNNETPSGKYAGVVKFSYKIYPGDPIEVYELEDGERCTIPRGVARHLAQNCFYYRHKPLEGGQGVMQALPGDSTDSREQNQYVAAEKVYRYSFHSLDFMDEDLGSDVAQANIIEIKKK